MSRSRALAPALIGDKSSLSNEAREKIRALSGARPVAFLAQAAGAWAVILAAIAAAVYANTLWVTLLVIAIIATRFNILALLVHEQVHFLGLRGRYGDLVANLLVAYPLLGITVEGYAGVHLSHHKHFFTEKDPDFLRKSGVDWTFPMPTAHLVKLFLSDLLGLTFIKLLLGKRLEDASVFRRPNPTPKWIRPCYYLAVALGLTYTGTWPLFALYWVIPLVMIFPMIV